MTTFMKIEAITYYILKLIGYIAGFIGPFLILGFVGGLEHDNITIAQFWIGEFYAFGLIGLSFIVYYVREFIKEDVRRRYRIMKRRAKRLAHAY